MELNSITVFVHGVAVALAALVGGDKVRVLPGDYESVGNIGVVLNQVPGADGGDSRRSIGLHGPLHNVHQVDSPIARPAVGIIIEVTERGPAAFRHTKPVEVVRDLGRGSQPEVPIKPSGRVAIRKRPIAIGEHVVVVPRAHKADLAQHAGLHKFHGLLEMQVGALPQADLRDAFVGARGGHHLLAFFHRHANWLLHVNILARLARLHHGKRMPVVRCADQNHINLFVIQHPAKIFDGLGLSAGGRQPLIQVGLVHIAHGGHFHAELHEVLHIVHALLAGADNTQPDAVVRPDHVRGAKARHRQAHAPRGHCCALNEISSINFVGHKESPRFVLTPEECTNQPARPLPRWLYREVKANSSVFLGSRRHG